MRPPTTPPLPHTFGCTVPLGLPQVSTDPYRAAGGPDRTLPRARTARSSNTTWRSLRHLRVACARRLGALEAEGRLVRGGSVRWITAGVVRRRRASPATATVAGCVAPRGGAGRAGGTAAFLPRGRASAPHGGVRNRSSRRSGAGRRAPFVASTLERDVPGARRRLSPTLLDEPCGSGEVVGSARERSARTTARPPVLAIELALVAPSWGSAKRPMVDRSPHPHRARWRGGDVWGRFARAWSGRRTTSCSRRSGTWCGPAR